MNNMEQKLKMYILPLKWDIWEKRFYFEGEDSPEAEEKFNQTCLALTPIGDSAIDAKDFYSKAIELFEKNGFSRIAK